MFDFGYCTGYSLLKCPGDITYLMSFIDGYLNGPVTIVNEKEKKVNALAFENGSYSQTIKSFKSGTDDFTEKLLNKIFPVANEDATTMTEVSKSIANKFVSLDDDCYIGTFCINNLGAYFGVMKNGQPFNYGILINQDFKVKIGRFSEGCLDGRARIIEKNGLILEGTFRNDLAVGEAYLYHSRQNVWKHISIKEKGGSEILQSGKGYPREHILKNSANLKNSNSNMKFYESVSEERQVI